MHITLNILMNVCVCVCANLKFFGGADASQAI